MTFRLHLILDNDDFNVKNQANLQAYRNGIGAILQKVLNGIPRKVQHAHHSTGRGTVLEDAPGSAPYPYKDIVVTLETLINGAKNPHDSKYAVKTNRDGIVKEEKSSWFSRLRKKAPLKAETINIFDDKYADFQFHPRLWSSDRTGHSVLGLSEYLEKNTFAERKNTYEIVREYLTSLLKADLPKQARTAVRTAIEELDSLQKDAVDLFRKNFRDATADKLVSTLNSISISGSGTINSSQLMMKQGALQNRLQKIKIDNNALGTRSESLDKNKEINSLRNDLLSFEKEYAKIETPARGSLPFKLSIDEIIQRLESLGKKLPAYSTEKDKLDDFGGTAKEITTENLNEIRKQLILNLKNLKNPEDKANKKGYRSINFKANINDLPLELQTIAKDLILFKHKYNNSKEPNAPVLYFGKNATSEKTLQQQQENERLENPELTIDEKRIPTDLKRPNLKPETTPSIDQLAASTVSSHEISSSNSNNSSKNKIQEDIRKNNEPADFRSLAEQLSILGKAYIDPYYEKHAERPETVAEKIRHWVKVNAMAVGGVSTILFIVGWFVPVLWPLEPLFAAGSFLALSGLVDPIYEAISNFVHGRSPSKGQGVQLSIIAGLVTTFFAVPNLLGIAGKYLAELGANPANLKGVFKTIANGLKKIAHVFPVIGKGISNIVAKAFPSINAPASVAEVVAKTKAAAVPNNLSDFKKFTIGDAGTVLSLLNEAQPSLAGKEKLRGVSAGTQTIATTFEVDFTTRKAPEHKGISKAFFVQGNKANNSNSKSDVNYEILKKESGTLSKPIYSRHEKISQAKVAYFYHSAPEKAIQKAVDQYTAKKFSLHAGTAERRQELNNIKSLVDNWVNSNDAHKYLDNKDQRDQLKENPRAFEDKGLSKQGAKIVLLAQWVNQEIKSLDQMADKEIYLVKAGI